MTLLEGGLSARLFALGAVRLVPCRCSAQPFTRAGDGDRGASGYASPRLCEGCAPLGICGHMGADGDGDAGRGGGLVVVGWAGGVGS
jgi:hypothetical protein